jgi:hypothetical protein
MVTNRKFFKGTPTSSPKVRSKSGEKIANIFCVVALRVPFVLFRNIFYVSKNGHNSPLEVVNKQTQFLTFFSVF